MFAVYFNIFATNIIGQQFVKVHQLLLSTVIGKHSIFAQFGVTAPIAAILRSLEAGIDVITLKS